MPERLVLSAVKRKSIENAIWDLGFYFDDY
jgi:hypothetical protein